MEATYKHPKVFYHALGDIFENGPGVPFGDESVEDVLKRCGFERLDGVEQELPEEDLRKGSRASAVIRLWKKSELSAHIEVMTFSLGPSSWSWMWFRSDADFHAFWFRHVLPNIEIIRRVC